jgi:hypothetical protein
MSDGGDDYVRVRGHVLAVRKSAILFAVGETVPRGAWIARSLIHGADERLLDGTGAGEARTIRIFRWKAEELGFEPDSSDEGQEVEDLFDKIERDTR